jgi:hypothetical protein
MQIADQKNQLIIVKRFTVKKSPFAVIWLLFLAISDKCFCQCDSEPFLKGYEQNFTRFLDSVNTLYLTELSSLDSSYEIYLKFRMDPKSNIVELQLFQLPDLQIPGALKQHVYRMLYASNGKWSPAVYNSKVKLSDEVIWRFDFIKRGNMNHIEGSKKFFEYYYGEGVKNTAIEDFLTNEHLKIFAFSY